MSFPKAAVLLACLLKGCQGRTKIRTNLWVNYVHLHVKDTMVVMDKGNRPNLHCYR